VVVLVQIQSHGEEKRFKGILVSLYDKNVLK
jgi:hypothetical protein